MEIVVVILVFVVLMPFFAVAYPVGKWANKKLKSSSRVATLSKRLVDYIEHTSSYILNYFQYQTIWRWINPQIVVHARQRFERGYYSDAVLTSIKEVNTRMKDIVQKKTGQELDGIKLMDVALSLNNPIIRLEDLRTETGRNIQAGYLNLFKGAMLALRNPHAHENIILTKEKAIRYLLLISLLMDAIDDGTQRDN